VYSSKLTLFKVVDVAAHRLHAWHLLPARPLGWLCNRFDLWLGVAPDELSGRNPRRRAQA
jgi:hypothetical protein